MKDSLKLPEVVPFLEALCKHVADYAPSYGDWNAQSLLQMLYVAFSQYNRFKTDDVKSGFADLYDLLKSLSLKSLDAVVDAACELCRSYEQAGLTEGVKIGVRLCDELRN